MSTKIEWADETWNPVTGCTKVSSGCANCYAERFAGRAMGEWKGRKFSEVRCHEDRLSIPLRMKKPRRIFVNSMSDLFHERVPFGFIDRVHAIILASAILANRRHTYQVLTKRIERAFAYYTSRSPVEHIQCWAKIGNGLVTVGDGDELFEEVVVNHCSAIWRPDGTAAGEWEQWSHPENAFPLPNLWLGVSAEDQATADQRIPLLLQTPAAKRFVSCEPLLGPVNLSSCHIGWSRCPECGTAHDPSTEHPLGCERDCEHCESERSLVVDGRNLNWVICGGESGPGARPFDVAWPRSLRDQCKAASVPFFLKQLGTQVAMKYYEEDDFFREEFLDRAHSITSKGVPWDADPSSPCFDGQPPPDAMAYARMRHPKGNDPAEWPEDLRNCREVP